MLMPQMPHTTWRVVALLLIPPRQRCTTSQTYLGTSFYRVAGNFCPEIVTWNTTGAMYNKRKRHDDHDSEEEGEVIEQEHLSHQAFECEGDEENKKKRARRADGAGNDIEMCGQEFASDEKSSDQNENNGSIFIPISDDLIATNAVRYPPGTLVEFETPPPRTGDRSNGMGSAKKIGRVRSVHLRLKPPIVSGSTCELWYDVILGDDQSSAAKVKDVSIVGLVHHDGSEVAKKEQAKGEEMVAMGDSPLTHVASLGRKQPCNRYDVKASAKGTSNEQKLFMRRLPIPGHMIDFEHVKEHLIGPNDSTLTTLRDKFQIEIHISGPGRPAPPELLRCSFKANKCGTKPNIYFHGDEKKVKHAIKVVNHLLVERAYDGSRSDDLRSQLEKGASTEPLELVERHLDVTLPKWLCHYVSEDKIVESLQGQIHADLHDTYRCSIDIRDRAHPIMIQISVACMDSKPLYDYLHAVTLTISKLIDTSARGRFCYDVFRRFPHYAQDPNKSEPLVKCFSPFHGEKRVEVVALDLPRGFDYSKYFSSFKNGSIIRDIEELKCKVGIYKCQFDPPGSYMLLCCDIGHANAKAARKKALEEIDNLFAHATSLPVEEIKEIISEQQPVSFRKMRRIYNEKHSTLLHQGDEPIVRNLVEAIPGVSVEIVEHDEEGEHRYLTYYSHGEEPEVQERNSSTKGSIETVPEVGMVCVDAPVQRVKFVLPEWLHHYCAGDNAIKIIDHEIDKGTGKFAPCDVKITKGGRSIAVEISLVSTAARKANINEAVSFITSAISKQIDMQARGKLWYDVARSVDSSKQHRDKSTYPIVYSENPSEREKMVHMVAMPLPRGFDLSSCVTPNTNEAIQRIFMMLKCSVDFFHCAKDEPGSYMLISCGEKGTTAIKEARAFALRDIIRLALLVDGMPTEDIKAIIAKNQPISFRQLHVMYSQKHGTELPHEYISEYRYLIAMIPGVGIENPVEDGKQQKYLTFSRSSSSPTQLKRPGPVHESLVSRCRAVGEKALSPDEKTLLGLHCGVTNPHLLFKEISLPAYVSFEDIQASFEKHRQKEMLVRYHTLFSISKKDSACIKIKLVFADKNQDKFGAKVDILLRDLLLPFIDKELRGSLVHDVAIQKSKQAVRNDRKGKRHHIFHGPYPFDDAMPSKEMVMVPTLSTDTKIENVESAEELGTFGCKVSVHESPKVGRYVFIAAENTDNVAKGRNHIEDLLGLWNKKPSSLESGNKSSERDFADRKVLPAPKRAKLCSSDSTKKTFLASVKPFVEALIKSEQPLRLEKLQERYKNKFFIDLNPCDSGFISMKDFVQSIPGVSLTSEQIRGDTGPHYYLRLK